MKHDVLIDYFDRELEYLRIEGEKFSRRYPKIARRLQLQTQGSADPHVERLIEAFAFLTARVNRKLDNEFSEIARALLSVVYPHFLAPVPSLAIVEFCLDTAKGRGTDAVVVPRGATVRSKPVDGTPCKFRTCYDLELWPLEIVSARVGNPSPEYAPPPKAQSVFSLEIRCRGDIPLGELSLSRLRFYLHGAARNCFHLYDFLMNQVSEVHFVDPLRSNVTVSRTMRSNCLDQLGFEADQGLLPYDSRTLLGHRILLEYFALPQKFLFIELRTLAEVVKQLSGSVLRVLCYSKRPYEGEPTAVHEGMLRLGCTPIVNLFHRTAERIPVQHKLSEYRVVPDRYQQSTMEVYQVRSVEGISRQESEAIPYKPFFSTSHIDRIQGVHRAYWTASRRPSGLEGDPGTEVYLSFVNLDFDPLRPKSEVLVVDTLCSNRELPGALPFGEEDDEFRVEGLPFAEIRCLTKPTKTQRVALEGGLLWRLVSHLSLNFSSFLDPENGRENLCEVLGLYDFRQSQATESQISGIHRVHGRPVAARVRSANGEYGIARGFEIDIEFDPAHYVGWSAFLMASVIERFLGSSVAMNSFCKVCAKLKDSEEYFKRWPPRTGSRSLL